MTETPAGYVATTIEDYDERDVRVFVKRLTPADADALRTHYGQWQAFVNAAAEYPPTPNPYADALAATVDQAVQFVHAADDIRWRARLQPALLGAVLRVNAAIHA